MREDEFYVGKESMKAMKKKDVTYNIFFKPREVKQKFHRDRLALGFDADRYLYEGVKKPVTAKLRESAFHSMILGKTGAGKTFYKRGLMDRLYAQNLYNIEQGFVDRNNIMVLTDVKNEFISSLNPTNKAGDFLPGEKPTSLPIKVFRPMFLGSEKKNIPFQIPLRKLTYFDMLTVFDMLSEKASPSQKMIMQTLASHIQSHQIQNIDDLRQEINDMTMSSVTKNFFLSKIDVLENNMVIGDRFNVDFGEMMRSGYIPVINWQGFEKLGRGVSGFPDIYIAIILRELMDTQRTGQIHGRLWLIIDEIRRFCSSRSESVSGKEIIDAVQLSRAWNVFIIMGAQDIVGIPSTLIEQSKYIFLPFNVDRPVAETILKMKGLYVYTSPDASVELNDELHAMRRRLPSGNRQWILVDSDKRNYKRIFPYSVLSKHG